MQLLQGCWIFRRSADDLEDSGEDEEEEEKIVLIPEAGCFCQISYNHCCFSQLAVSGQVQPEHFDWLQALAPVRMHLHSAKAWAYPRLLPPVLKWRRARKVFRGWEGDLLLVAYLRHPACYLPAPALAKLCEARLVCMLPIYHV